MRAKFHESSFNSERISSFLGDSYRRDFRQNERQPIVGHSRECEISKHAADLCADRFLEPATAQEHYEPPRHYFHMLPAGHRSHPGPFESV